MGNLEAVIRKGMLHTITRDFDSETNLRYIELISDPQIDFGRHAIFWQDIDWETADAKAAQDGNISITKLVETGAAPGTSVTGFKFYGVESDGDVIGEGEFSEPVSLTDGVTYSINISNIKINLPE